MLAPRVGLAQQRTQINLRGGQNAGAIQGTPVLVVERQDTVIVIALLAPFALDVRPGDQILAVNGTPITLRSQLDRAYGEIAGGASVELRVRRDKAERSIEGTKPTGPGPQVQMISQEEAARRGLLPEGGGAVDAPPAGKVVETRLYDLTRLRRAHWRELARDASGDGASATAPDVTALSDWIDTKAGMIWFRFELADAVPADGFGVNLVIDADEDQATGTPWWGSNRSFTYDRYVTVWIGRNGDRLSGVIGVGDAAGAAAGSYNNLEQGGIEVAVDDDARAIMIGVARSTFDADLSANIIAAVGTASAWNDDITDRGHVTISPS